MFRRPAIAGTLRSVHTGTIILRDLVSFAALIVCITYAAHSGVVRPDDETVIRTPASQIELTTVGYSGLSAGARQAGASNLSVDFLDSGHVLLTFNPKKLFQRHPECPSTHSDRLVHAVVMGVPSGSIVRETDWYVHDLRRYVWALGEGRVLLRRLNSLYEVNANLEEKRIFDSPRDLLWVSVTPDRKQIIVEEGEGQAIVDETKEVPAAAAHKGGVKISFLDATTLAVQRTMEAAGVIKLEGSSLGTAHLRKQGSNWLVEIGDSSIARVRAQRAVSLLYPSENTLLIGRCSSKRVGYSLSAFTVKGTSLWRQHWDECRYAPRIRNSEEGNRFGISSMTLLPSPQGVDESNSATSAEGLVQHLQVFDTASGRALLSVTTAPAVLDGQNFSLSPEGTLAVAISGTRMNVYDLPPSSPADRERYVAVKTDTLNLTVPAAQGSTESAESENAEDSSDAADALKIAAKIAAARDLSAALGQPSVSGNVSEANESIPGLTLHTGTQVVALDVVVTDSGGHLVKGLQKSDFKVTEDGKPQSLRYFQEFADKRPATAQAPLTKQLPPNVFSNQSVPAEQGAVTLVLLDLLNTPQSDQAYAQNQLIKFLKNKPEDAKFALCVLGTSLQMAQGFTEDKTTLLGAASGRKMSNRVRPVHGSDPLPPITMEGNGAATRFQPGLDAFASMLTLQASEERMADADQRMIVTVDAFAQLARFLSGVPGRKNIVWLSGSFLLGIYPDSNGENPFLGTRDYGENVKKVANLLGEAHVAVYPVDVKGLQTNPFFGAANDTSISPLSMQPSYPARLRGPGGTIDVRGGRVPNPNLDLPVDVMRDQIDQFERTQIDEHATMKELAAHTGGQAFYNTNGIADAIRTAADQGSNYYALSYTPFNKKYDGSFRRVKVTLAGKKYHLAYRAGYYAVDPSAPAPISKDLSSTLARAAMQAGSPQSRQILFAARVVPVGKPRSVQDAPAHSKPRHRGELPAPREVQRYAIDDAVTLSDLRFSTSPDGGSHGRLNFMITAFDQDGKLLASQLAQTAANFNPDAMKDVLAGGVRMHQEIDVPTKCTTLRMGVEDVSNGHVGTLEISLPVPAPPEEAAQRKLPRLEPD